MEGIVRNIKFTRGDTYGFNMEIDAELEMAKLTCRASKEKTSKLLFQKTLADGITKVDDIYVIRIAPEDTEDLAVGSYYYDLEIGINGDIYTPLKGKLTLTWEVS